MLAEKAVPISSAARHRPAPKSSSSCPLEGGDAEEMIAEFARAGIDCDKLATDLQREAAESFVKDWDEMLASIASKCAGFKAAG